MVDLQRIEDLAKENGFSMSYLCKKMDVSRCYFNDIKRTGRDIPPERLSILADLLHTTPEYLKGEASKPRKTITLTLPLSSVSEAISSAVSKMTNEELEKLSKMIKLIMDD
jgi:transcriptional regulator with XRE-family HTH domain